jgi:hypothetical protein
MLTTLDNPFDYFDQFTSWNQFDVESGYNTCCYLARMVNLSDEMSEEEVNIEVERAIDDIIAHDFLGIYKKIRKTPKHTEPMTN